MSLWNPDLTKAPQDGSRIWALPRDEKKPAQCTYWAKAKNDRGGYWAGFKSDGTCDPVAWQPYIVPARTGAVSQPMAISTVNHEFLAACDGVGSGA